MNRERFQRAKARFQTSTRAVMGTPSAVPTSAPSEADEALPSASKHGSAITVQGLDPLAWSLVNSVPLNPKQLENAQPRKPAVRSSARKAQAAPLLVKARPVKTGVIAGGVLGVGGLALLALGLRGGL